MSIYASFFSWPMVDSYLNIGRHSWQSCGGGNNFHHHFIRHSTYSVRLFPNACGVFCRIRTDKQPQKDFGSIYRCGIWYHARTEMVRAIRPRPCMVLFLFRPHFSFFSFLCFQINSFTPTCVYTWNVPSLLFLSFPCEAFLLVSNMNVMSAMFVSILTFIFFRAGVFYVSNVIYCTCFRCH